MIVASCPLRISLVGGSTDSPKFLEKYNRGAVISFPSTLRTYVSIHRDVFGSNSIDERYNISYSRREQVEDISDIQNELVRECLSYLQVGSINCSLTSDIHSVGSGLAASSSYLQSMIKAIHVMQGIAVSEFEICKIAEKIERKFNPLVGQQDFYGSMGGFKRIDFRSNRDPDIRYLDSKIFDQIEIYLWYSGVHRNSTLVLQSVDISKSVTMLDDVKELEQAINSCDIERFGKVITRSWLNKKEISPDICSHPTLINMDETLAKDTRIIAHKLCGAGNGGYFLVLANKGSGLSYPGMKRIGISETGLKYINLDYEFNRF